MKNEAGKNPVALPAPTRHPLVVPCVAVLLGGVLGLRVPQPAIITVGACLAALGVWLLLMRRASRDNRWLAGASLAVSVLAGCLAWHTASRHAFARESGRALFQRIADSRTDVVFRGRVAGEPTIESLAHGGARMRFPFDVRQVGLADAVVDTPPMRIRVNRYGPVSMRGEHPPFPLPAYGEGWALDGRLRLFRGRRAAVLFDLDVRRSAHERCRQPRYDAPGVMRMLGAARRDASHTLALGLDARHDRGLAMVRAMTLGFRSEIPRAAMAAFRLSGTVHVFAISGLHVGIVATLLMGLLSLLPIRRRYRVLVFGPLIVAYTFATGAAPSAVRACIMSLFYFSGPLLDRRADPVSSLCAAAMLIVFMNPGEVVELGFVFSFVCAAGIILLVPVLNVLLTRGADVCRRAWRNRAGAVSECWRDRPGSDSGAGWAARFQVRLIQAVAVSMAAWVASTPMTAYFFGRITPVALVCNLLVIPLAFLIVVCAAISLLAGLLLPGLSALINHVNVAVADALFWIAQTASAWPGASHVVAPWRVVHVVAWYAVVLVLEHAARTWLSQRQTGD